MPLAHMVAAIAREPAITVSGDNDMKVIARKDACAGHARCAAVGSDFYELDDDGYIGFTEKDVPPGLETQARHGVRGCPERVLSIADE
jgi:ferredoxin